MASTYKVQSGDTLSGIAKKLGIDSKSISGYKSGNPDLIYAGENLTYGAPKSDASVYSSEVKNQLGDAFGGTTKDTTGGTTPVTNPEKGSDLYDIGKLRTDIDTYKTNLDASPSSTPVY